MLTGEVLTSARTIALRKVKDASVGKHVLDGQTRFNSSPLFVGRQLSGASWPLGGTVARTLAISEELHANGKGSTLQTGMWIEACPIVVPRSSSLQKCDYCPVSLEEP